MSNVTNWVRRASAQTRDVVASRDDPVPMKLLRLDRSPRRSHHANAVVTGAGSGIGRAFAMELARRGGQVVCADIDPVRAKETVGLAVRAGGEGLDIAGDVSSEKQVRELATSAEKWFGQTASLVINNTGIGAGGNVIGATSKRDWEATLSVNLWGVIHGCEVFVPRLRAGGSGGIVNVASAASFGAAPRMRAYNVSKAGVLALSETLSAELNGTGVGVTVLCPTFVKTNIVDNPHIEESAAKLATNLMKWTGVSPGIGGAQDLECERPRTVARPTSGRCQDPLGLQAGGACELYPRPRSGRANRALSTSDKNKEAA